MLCSPVFLLLSLSHVQCNFSVVIVMLIPVGFGSAVYLLSSVCAELSYVSNFVYSCYGWAVSLVSVSWMNSYMSCVLSMSYVLVFACC